MTAPGQESQTNNENSTSAETAEIELDQTHIDPDPLALSNLLAKIYVNPKLTCQSEMEVPYYSCALWPPACFYCGSEERLAPSVDDSVYPICEACVKSKVAKKKQKRTMTEKAANAAKDKEAKKAKTASVTVENGTQKRGRGRPRGSGRAKRGGVATASRSPHRNV